MGVFNFNKKVYRSIFNCFSLSFRLFSLKKCKKILERPRKLLSDLSIQFKEEANEKALIEVERNDLLKQIERLKQAFKAKGIFAKESAKRYQKSLTHARELIEISNRLALESDAFYVSSNEVKKLNQQIEQALKSLECGCIAPLVISEIKIHDLIDEITTHFILEVLENNTQILNTVKEKELYIQNDSLLLKKIFIYLLAKAFLRLPMNGKIEIESRVLKGNAMICLRDNGYFLDKDINDYLFKGKENNFMSEESLMFLVRELKGKVEFTYTSKEKHEVRLWFPLKWEEDDASRV